MFPPISPADLATLIDEADAAARRLHRRLGAQPADLDDLRQDLLVDIICRLPGYDSRRGSIGAFANIVLRNQCSRIATRVMRERRTQPGSPVSLDAPSGPGDPQPLAETIGEDKALSVWLGQPDPLNTMERRAALRSALARLPEPDLRFCAALAHRSVTSLAADGFGSRSALYRRLADLRHVLTAYGLGPAWDDFATA